MFTEKERMILKALLEEEFQTILSQDGNDDILLKRYLFSLARILSKIDVDETEDSSAERFCKLGRELAIQQIA